MEVIERTCPTCEVNDYSPLPQYSHPDWPTVKCNRCDLVYLLRGTRYDALSEDISWTKQHAIERERRKEREPILLWLDEKTRWRMRLFKKKAEYFITKKVRSGNVLDLGCGGFNRIPDCYTPFGVEIEKKEAAIANTLMQAKGGYVQHAPALEGINQFEDGFFDGITMHSYLEHELNPKQILAACHQKLKPKGTIYLKVPNYGTINRVTRGGNWCGFRYPDHLNYFRVTTLRRMAASTGFDLTLINKFTQFTSDSMHCFLDKR